jgi:translation initiation factor IF-3
MSIPQKPSKSNEPRSNTDITVPKVRLVGADGEMVGVVNTREALQMARDAGLDLVEVSPNAEPPVCKILDIGKYKYELQKRTNAARKKQKIVQIKEIKLRPNIDEHDYEIKLRNAKRFIAEGDKVKVSLRFRGREMDHQDIGRALLVRMEEAMMEEAKVEARARMEGRQMVMVLGPK